MGNLIIRNAQAIDAGEIVLMVKQVMREAPFFPRSSEEFNFTAELEAAYIESTALFLVAEVGGKIVGSATLDRSDLSKLRHTVTFGITILKDYCSMGLGSKLMRQVINWVEENEVEKIDLEVFEDNKPAIALYEKFGFIKEGIKKKAIKTETGYQNMLLMGRISHK